MGRLAIDIGGTFVDGVVYDPDSNVLNIRKTDTTPEEPTRGVMNVIGRLPSELTGLDTFIHGTTLGLNSLLEREGAKTGIITNEGFRDVFELGRYDRPHDEMVNPSYTKPESLVPRYLRTGVEGRIDHEGTEITALNEAAVISAAEELIRDEGVTSLAICFLHSYVNPEHELRSKRLIQDRFPEVSISISSEITREFREFERTSTTVLDAYIKPIFRSYIDNLASSISEGGFDGAFLITRSGGGSLAIDNAKETPIHSLLSGPAGGIIGAQAVGSAIQRGNLITADMGGTSLDTCVITDGEPVIKHESTIETHKMLIPVFDIRTVGAGGGSIAWLDGELLKVGPKSAGASPGPICYGRGGQEPTVTDAAVLLGYIQPDRFLGGEMELAVDDARRGIESKLAADLNDAVEEVCKGIFRVTVGNIKNSIREITVERGLDPREYSLLAYGGAGPMIMPLLGQEMRVREVIVPQAPSVFSAWGLLLSDIIYDFSVTSIATLSDTEVADLEEDFRALEQRGAEKLAADGFTPDRRAFDRSIEMRYVGQQHTVNVPGNDFSTKDELNASFQQRYESRYGHVMDDEAEIVHLRTRAIGITDKPDIGRVEHSDSEQDDDRGRDRVEAYCFAEQRFKPFDVVPRSTIGTGDTLTGPVIVHEPAATTVVFSDQELRADRDGHLIITEEGE